MITGKLSDNGLSYAIRRAGKAVAYCSLTVHCGTRSEGKLPAGTAHFVEHTLFKGTSKRSAAQIGSYLDKLGGELNAYTTKEEIVLHATVLKEDIWKAVGLLLEIATDASFPEKDINIEKGVVIDEIISYKDSPSDDIFDRFEEMLFEGHDLGRSILGSAKSVKSIKKEHLHEYIRNNFKAGNMVLSVVADLNEAETLSKIEKLAGRCFPTNTYETTLAQAPASHDAIVEGKVFRKRIDKRNHEANAIIGGTAPSLYQEADRICAVLLSNIIGGPGSNSMLNAELRERHGWVYGVECSYTQYSDSGVMAISLGCDKENLDKCLNAVYRILEKMRTQPLGETRLKAAKKQLLGQLAISSESGEAQCLSMGKSMSAFGQIASDDDNMSKIMAVTANDILSMAQKIFAPERMSELIFL